MFLFLIPRALPNIFLKYNKIFTIQLETEILGGLNV